MAPGEKLLVGDLPFDITEDELRTVFKTYGTVSEVQLTGPKTATVTYTKHEAAEDAISVLHDVYKIRVDAEQPISVRWASDSEDKKDRDFDHRGASNQPGAGADRDHGDSVNDRGQASRADSGGKEPTGHKVFVGGLPENIREEELQSVFGTYGTINHIHIMKRSEITGLRAAFVYYEDKDAAEDAIQVLDKIYKIRTDAEAPIRVAWAAEKDKSQGARSETGHKLFVGSLPGDITEDEVNKVFSTYGQVNLIHLLSPNNSSGNKAALVFYETREAGEDAITMLHEKYKIREDADEALRVKWGKDDDKGKVKGKDKDKDKGKGKGKGNDDADHGGKGGKDSKGWQNENSWGQSKWGGDDRWKDRQNDRWQDSANSWSNDRDRGNSWSSSSNAHTWGNDRGWDRDGGKDNGKGGNDRDKGWERSGGWDEGRWGDRRSDGKGDKKGDGKGDKKGGREACGDFKRGLCTRGDSCRYSHEDDRGRSRSRGRGGAQSGYGAEAPQGNDPEPEPSGTVYVANLPEDIKEDQVEYVFANYGKVQKITLLTGKIVKGAISGFVEYRSTEDAETAILSLHEKYEIRAGFGPLLVKHARRQSASQQRAKPY